MTNALPWNMFPYNMPVVNDSSLWRKDIYNKSCNEMHGYIVSSRKYTPPLLLHTTLRQKVGRWRLLNYSIHLMDMLLSSFLAIFKPAEVDNYNNCGRRASSLKATCIVSGDWGRHRMHKLMFPVRAVLWWQANRAIVILCVHVSKQSTTKLKQRLTKACPISKLLPQARQLHFMLQHSTHYMNSL